MFTLKTFDDAKSRIAVSGSFVLAKWRAVRFKRLWAVMAATLCLVGSAHQAGSGMAVQPASVTRDLAGFSRTDMMRYVYMLQAALADNPDLFTQIDERKVRLVLAGPDLLRRDGGTQSWQYRAGACVLDVFMTGNRDQVVHYEFRSADALNEQEPDHWQCLQSLYQTRRADIEKEFDEIYAEAQIDTAG